MAKQTYEIVVEGVISKTHIVDAENEKVASETARRQFSEWTGANYHALAVVDIFKTPGQIELNFKKMMEKHDKA